MKRFAVVLTLALALACSKKSDGPLAARAEAARVKAAVPAIAYAWFTGETQEIGIVGEAKPDVFHAASIAKTMIGTAVMQLVVEKKLALDTDVSQYVGFQVRHPRHPTVVVTLRLLLSHLAALADDFDTLQAPGDLEPFLRAYVSLPSHWRKEAPDGVVFHYSNVGSAVAALAVERAAGRSFAEQTEARIFEPLKMSSTKWDRRRAVYPVVDLQSTASDLARFGRAMLRGGELDGTRILPAGDTAELLQGRLGWQFADIGSFAVIGHEGEDKNASTGLYVHRQKGVGALVLANGNAFSSGNKQRAAAIGDLLDTLLTTAVRSRDAN